MKTSDPYTQLALGKKKGYQNDKWLTKAHDTLLKANKSKYMQHVRAKQALLDAGKRLLGEASRDTVFGIGLSLNDKNVNDATVWNGNNMMGKILLEIHSTLTPTQ